MFTCPNCNIELSKCQTKEGLTWVCRSCLGRTATISMLRKNVTTDAVNSLWQTASHTNNGKKACPCCNKVMANIKPSQLPELDVCKSCQFVWLDSGEHDALPKIPVQATDWRDRLPEEAREKIAIADLKYQEEKRREETSKEPPDSGIKAIISYLGFPVEEDEQCFNSRPWVTWGLSFIILLVFVISYIDESIIQTFAMIPAQYDRYFGLTLISSFFLHAGILHLLGNLYFFLIFGDNVEDYLGKIKFLALIFLSTLAGDIAHILGDPHSTIPCVGASGGISGVIIYYALKFPHAKLCFAIRIFYMPRWIRMSAISFFGLWIVLQILGSTQQFMGTSNVSYLAHLGGALVGFAFWFYSFLRDSPAKFSAE